MTGLSDDEILDLADDIPDDMLRLLGQESASKIIGVLSQQEAVSLYGDIKGRSRDEAIIKIVGGILMAEYDRTDTHPSVLSHRAAQFAIGQIKKDAVRGMWDGGFDE